MLVAPDSEKGDFTVVVLEKKEKRDGVASLGGRNELPRGGGGKTFLSHLELGGRKNFLKWARRQRSSYPTSERVLYPGKRKGKGGGKISKLSWMRHGKKDLASPIARQ